ncbi:helix-turn-helix domain-containing protein [Hoyosella sp. YIM 151337]|uniref:PucR family transcriptional regulator n=1 Tax=Hoyosella sp. YIM 151337 TaxID=2992742 RepID=UPI002236B598|nr:helix-turn-helix domain-containing protein [Hoyosella sp. YIM 151337]MCW4351759.1 helix-turn-helix domain-containing protein [Hoyosella sp. YIM 151337]
MDESTQSREFRQVSALAIDSEIIAALRAELPLVAEHTVRAVTMEVPSYARAFSGRMAQVIENAVQMALGALLQLAARSDDEGGRSPLPPAMDGAYELGRGEARQGRSMDALLAAYRVGARVAWREMSAIAVSGGLAATTVARFAELAFAFIDELSAASIAGHADELSTTGLARQRYLDQLALQLLTGESEDALLASAERADWQPPDTLTAVVLPVTRTRGLFSRFAQSLLQLSENLPGVDDAEDLAVMLVPDMGGRQRSELLRVLSGREAIVGPAKPWTTVRASYLRVLRARSLPVVAESGADVIDTDKLLVDLILSADAEAAADLRAQVLEPLSDLRPNSAEKLIETLRSWLLHLGQRDAVAADLYIHAQSVRYRMSQLRELYGDRLNDPETVLALTVALGANGPKRGASL